MLHNLLGPKNGINTFLFLIFIFYFTVPLFVWFFSEEDRPEMVHLCWLSILLIFFILIGSKLPILKISAKLKIPKNSIDFIAFSFIALFILIITTAPSIPIFDAINGASSEALKVARGDFLKTRTGYETIYIYLSSIYISSLAPYIIILSFVKKNKLRHIYLSTYILYSFAFLQKSLFLNIGLPFLVYLVINKTITTKGILKVIIFFFSILLLLVSLTYDPNIALSNNNFTISEYMSSKYIPNNSIDYFLWRSLAVPVFTASDTLLVMINIFNNENLWGGTSKIFSLIANTPPVNLERYVFEYQFGGWNDIMNANSVYHIEGYANFGIPGVVLYGLISGYIFKVFKITKNTALASMWILFAWSIFNASLLGVLLSNGWIITFIISIFINNRQVDRHERK